MNSEKMNRKGFTLIELIAAMVLLSLLVMIIVPTTSRVLKKSNQSVDKVTKNNVIAAARNWATDNKNNLPKSGSKIISVSQLQSLGYIDKNIKLTSEENINEKCIKITNITKEGGRPRYKYEYSDNCTGSSDLILKATTASGNDQPSGQCTNQNILMSVTSDYQGSYSWQKNNTLIDVPSNNYSTKVTKNQEIKDTYKVLLNAEDGIHSATYVACVDKKAPDIKLTTAVSANNNLTINLTDNLSGLSGYAVTTSAQTPTTWTSISGKSNQVIKSLAAGTYYVYAKDNVGNTNYTIVEVPKYQFILTYNYNSATGGATSSNKTVTYNQAYGTLPSPTRSYTVTYNSNGGSAVSNTTANYTFNGWYKESTFTNQVTENTIYNTNGNSTIYAKWTSSQITLPTPTKTGYTFAGWYSDSALTKSVGAAGAKYTPTSNITLYAKWEAKTFTLTYNYNGATGGKDAVNKTVTYNQSYGTLPSPTRSYTVTYNSNGGSTASNATATYTFNGWYKESALTNQVTSSTIYNTNGNSTIYAKWTSAQVTLPTPTKTGYTFSGWYSDSALTKSIGAAGAKYTPTSNITLYAKWTINSYTLTVNPNGGTWGGKTTNSTVTQNYNTTKNLGVPTPPAGYTVTYNNNGGTNSQEKSTSTKSFSGWTKTGNGSYISAVANPSASGMTMAKKTDSNGTYYNYTYNVSGLTSDTWYFSRFPAYTYVSGSTYEIRFKIRVNSSANGTIAFRHAALVNDYGTPGLVTKYFNNATSGWQDVTLTRTITGTTTTLNNKTVTIAPVFEFYTNNLKSQNSTLDFDIRDIQIINKTNGTIVQSSNNSYLYGVGAGTVTANYTNNSITLPTPTKTGYTFAGWYSDSALTKSVGAGGAKYTPTSNITLYAKWEAKTFTLTYNYNGATGGKDAVNKTVTYNQAYGTLPSPTRSYTVTYNSNGGSAVSNTTATYTFGGWYKESALTNQVTSSTIYNINSNSTIYAKWTSSQITLPTPTKTGYNFAGWYSDSALTKSVGAAGTKYTPTANITLYAKWEAKTFTLTYNYNGASVGKDAVNKTVTYNQAYGTLPSPTRTYTVTYNNNGGTGTTSATATYTFGGWYKESALTNQVTSSTIYNTNGNSTIYAKWTSSQIILPTPTKTGYNFAGWYSDSALTKSVGAAGTKYTPTSNITLYAKWEAKTFTLTYNYNGATSASSCPSGYVEIGGVCYLEKSASSERACLSSTFEWDATLKVCYDPSHTTNKTSSSNKTVTYNQPYGTLPSPTRSYTVTYNSNGGSAVSNTTANYTFNGWYKESTFTNQVTENTIYNTNGNSTIYAKWTSAQVTLPTPTKTGYTFAGWYSDSALTKSVGAAGAKYTPTSNITLYAKFIDDIKPTAPTLQSIYKIWGSKKYTYINGYASDAGTTGTWTTTGTDPIIDFGDVSTIKNISGAYIELNNSLTKDIGVQIFYSTSSGYSEANSKKATLKAGQTKLKIPLPKDNYKGVRFDIGAESGLSYKINVLGLIADNGQANNNYVIVHSNSTDAGSGIDHYEWNKKGTWTASELTTTNDQGEIAFTLERNEDIEFRAIDKAGNISDVSKVPIKIDFTPPTFTSITNSSGGSMTANPVVINAKASDNISGMDKIVYKYSGSNTEYSDWGKKNTPTEVEGTWSAERNNEVLLVAYDKVGNSRQQSAGKVYIVKDSGFTLYGQKTCDGDCNLPGTSYWNDKLWRWWWTGASSGINRNSFYLNYSTEWVTNYCTYNANNLPYGSRSSCGYVQFNSGDIYYSRSYAKSSIVVHICTNSGVCKDNTQTM